MLVQAWPGDLEMPNQSVASERCPGQNVSGLITTDIAWLCVVWAKNIIVLSKTITSLGLSD